MIRKRISPYKDNNADLDGKYSPLTVLLMDLEKNKNKKGTYLKTKPALNLDLKESDASYTLPTAGKFNAQYI